MLIAGLLFVGGVRLLKAQDSALCNDSARTCLMYMGSMYLKALLVHKPDALPVSENVRFTEDGVEKKLGEGLWKSISRFRGAPHVFITDVPQGVLGIHTVVEENGAPALLVVRLKTVAGRITEVETMITRGLKEGVIFDVDAIKLSPAMYRVPPKSALNSREEAIRIAESYPQGLKAGSFVTVDVPFAPEAYRLENGRLMAGQGCTFLAGCENIKTQPIPKLSGITYRVAAVDEDLGIVWLRQDFGPGSTTPGNSLIVWEAFKVYGGQIHAVEASMKVMPAGSKSGWD